MAETEPGAAGGYVAFISYSHKDAKVGRWLHRRLEGYRLPKRLAGTQGDDGEVPARLTPIFRDRDELPAAGDLSERVRAALGVSRSLIVICSPDSAASPWVAKEIATFRELHPRRPVFAAIVGGEPGQCFPSALREGGLEPLAADLRKAGDGRRLGVLKLIAGLAGVGLDTLVQRDAARRVRQVGLISAAAVAAMLVMALLTVLALDARAEAQRQSAQAEGLVEFMLTDLREELRSVGRIDVHSKVNERALAYYAAQPSLRDLPDDSIERRARVLHAMGEDDQRNANHASALARFREAHAATGAILARRPNAPQAIFVHGQSEYWLGSIHQLRGEWPQAADRYARYAAAARRLIEMAPNNPDYMLEMAWGASNRGVVERDGAGNLPAAQQSFGSAIGWFQKAILVRPRDGDKRDLANAYGELADAYYADRRWRDSLKARQDAYRIYESLYRADPANAESAYRLVIAQRSLALLSARLGDRTIARRFLAEADAGSRKLVALDPENAEWQLLRTKVECNLLDEAKPDAAEPLLRSIGRAGREFEARKNPRASEIHLCLGRVEARLGQVDGGPLAKLGSPE